MGWEIIREERSLLAAKINRCTGCGGGNSCPLDLLIEKIKSGPPKFNLVDYAEQTGLVGIEAFVNMTVMGQGVEAVCPSEKAVFNKGVSGKVELINTNKEGLAKLDSAGSK